MIDNALEMVSWLERALMGIGASNNWLMMWNNVKMRLIVLCKNAGLMLIVASMQT